MFVCLFMLVLGMELKALEMLGMSIAVSTETLFIKTGSKLWVAGPWSNGISIVPWSMFHSFIEQILKNVYISGIILAPEATEMNKTDHNPCPEENYVLAGGGTL